MEHVDDQEKFKSFTGDYHYIPHHSVIPQDSKTTKLRITYNGWAKTIGDEYLLMTAY